MSCSYYQIYTKVPGSENTETMNATRFVFFPVFSLLNKFHANKNVEKKITGALDLCSCVHQSPFTVFLGWISNTKRKWMKEKM